MQNESHLDFYLRWHALSGAYFLWQHEQFEPFLGQCVADIGCGIGNLTDFSKKGRKYIGVDIDPQMISHLSSLFRDEKNVELIHGDITDKACVGALKERKPDTVLCINTLEHIENDRLALENLFDLLPLGGYCCLLVPALPCIFGSLDERDGHYRRYTKRVLIDKLKGLPAEMISLYYFNLIGAIGWYVRGRILRAATQSNSDYKLVNALVPVLSRLEKMIRPPFGLSLIAVCRKTEKRHE